MSNASLQKLDFLVKQSVLLSLSHQAHPQSPIINDTTLQAFVVDIQESDSDLIFHLSQSTAEGSLTTIKIPKDALLRITGTSVALTYQKGEQTIIMSLKRTSAHTPESKDLPSKQDLPYVKEFKDTNGTIKKIVIHIPSDSVDQLLLSTATAVVNELLQEWRVISLAKRSGGQLTWQYQKLQVKEVTLVYLPGDSFMQLQTFEQKDQVTIDLPLDLFINLVNHTISFTFDETHYELVKTARENGQK